METTAARNRLVDDLVASGAVEQSTTEAALRAVPRHRFVPAEHRAAAYEDRPLPIGNDQTISAPHIVGRMLDLLALEPGDRVLEIGTGCGYHAAVTAEVVGAKHVYSVEYDPELAGRARDRLADLGYDINIRVGDGRAGWPEHAPFDGTYLTCAPADPPDALITQTNRDGVVVGPFGRDQQVLCRLHPTADGGYEREEIVAVRFVPMRSD